MHLPPGSRGEAARVLPRVPLGGRRWSRPRSPGRQASRSLHPALPAAPTWWCFKVVATAGGYYTRTNTKADASVTARTSGSAGLYPSPVNSLLFCIFQRESCCCLGACVRAFKSRSKFSVEVSIWQQRGLARANTKAGAIDSIVGNLAEMRVSLQVWRTTSFWSTLLHSSCDFRVMYSCVLFHAGTTGGESEKN